MPGRHRAFLAQALPALQADPRLEGVAAGGSFVRGEMDEQSDVDLVVVSAVQHAEDVVDRGADLARRLGPLLTAFIGDHVGELRLLICLYGPPLLHVDLKFMSTDELASRPDDPRVLWDRRGRVRAVLASSHAAPSPPRVQWMEDRFWVWVHYVADKIARRELFEVVDGLTFVRARVLGPLVLAATGAAPHGVRRIEAHAPREAERLRATVATPDVASCEAALAATVALYIELRDRVAPATLVRRTAAERAVKDFLAERKNGRLPG
jgi:predicted nucleotidyltransferase